MNEPIPMEQFDPSGTMVNKNQLRGYANFNLPVCKDMKVKGPLSKAVIKKLSDLVENNANLEILRRNAHDIAKFQSYVQQYYDYYDTPEKKQTFLELNQAQFEEIKTIYLPNGSLIGTNTIFSLEINNGPKAKRIPYQWNHCGYTVFKGGSPYIYVKLNYRYRIHYGEDITSLKSLKMDCKTDGRLPHDISKWIQAVGSFPLSYYPKTITEFSPPLAVETLESDFIV